MLGFLVLIYILFSVNCINGDHERLMQVLIIIVQQHLSVYLLLDAL